MEVQTSHLAAALMSTTSTFNNNVTTSESIPAVSNIGQDENKNEKPSESNKEPCEEEKEEAGTGDEFSDEVFLVTFY